MVFTQSVNAMTTVASGLVSKVDPNWYHDHQRYDDWRGDGQEHAESDDPKDGTGSLCGKRSETEQLIQNTENSLSLTPIAFFSSKF